MQLAGKVAIVTGGVSGLGLATVQEFLSAGARVAVFDLNDVGGSALMEKNPQSLLYRHVDVADENSVQAAVNDVKERFGAIHICVNCAGISKAMRTLGKEGPQPLSVFRRVIEVNLIGSFNVLRLAAEAMAQNTPEDDDNERGVIINTASAAAFEGQVGQASYSASKGGVVGMTLPIARDLAPYGIRINAIAPGLIYTPLFQSLPQPTIDGLVNSIQFPKRLGKPEEYAQLVRHLVENKYLNGETIRLDAGARLQPR